MNSALRITQYDSCSPTKSRPEQDGETKSGDVLRVSVFGIMTDSEIQAIRAKMIPLIATSNAVCIDFSKTVLAVSQRGFDALFAATMANQGTPNMVWLVPDAETAVAWRQEATRYALCGLNRFATHRPEEALEWAQGQSRLFAQQLLWS